MRLDSCRSNVCSGNLQEWMERRGRFSIMLASGVQLYRLPVIASLAVNLFLGHEIYLRIHSASNSPNLR